MRSLAHFPAWASLGATPFLFYPKHFEQKKAHLKSNNQTKLEQKQNQTTNDNLSSFHTWQGRLLRSGREHCYCWWGLPELGCDLLGFASIRLWFEMLIYMVVENKTAPPRREGNVDVDSAYGSTHRFDLQGLSLPFRVCCCLLLCGSKVAFPI